MALELDHAVNITLEQRKSRRPGLILAIAMSLAAFTSDAAGATANPCESEMTRAAKDVGVPVAVLYAVALTETGQRGSLNAYAMNIDGRAAYNSNLDDALEQFMAAKRRGARYIDVGCMQINHHFHGKKFASVEEMFDPARNVDYAAHFLKALKAGEGSWTAAVARYHAGPGNAPAQRRYVCAVIANMIASGFGAWTAESSAFCRR